MLGKSRPGLTNVPTLSRPVWCLDCNRGQHPASTKEVTTIGEDKLEIKKSILENKRRFIK